MAQIQHKLSTIPESKLERALFNLRRDELEEKVKRTLVFLNVHSSDKTVSFIMDAVLPMIPVAEVDKFLRKLQSQELLDHDFILGWPGGERLDLSDAAYGGPGYYDAILKLLNYTADDHSHTSVGKGEFFFNLILPETEMSQKAGDLMVADRHLEVKGTWSKLCSQKTHSSPMVVGRELGAMLAELAPGSKLKSLTAGSLTSYYPQLLKHKATTFQFLRHALHSLAFRAKLEDFDYLHDCIKDDGAVDVDVFKRKQGAFEYSYYTDHEEVDWIFFINPSNGAFLPVRESADLECGFKEFQIRIDYSFASEQGRALRWRLM